MAIGKSELLFPQLLISSPLEATTAAAGLAFFSETFYAFLKR